MTLLIALALLAPILAIWLHHLFEGEFLPLDLWREFRLSRRTLHQLDAAWSANTTRSDIVISLTTTPSRINFIQPTLKSLLDQRELPARIVLNVPIFSEREQIAYAIPAALQGLKSVEIRRCEDLGPATKLIPTMQAVDPDTPILVVDDDRIYARWLVQLYAAEAAQHPDRAATLAGWIAPENLTDEDTTILSNLFMLPPAPIRAPRLRQPREIDVMLGVMSYLVRPRFFDLEEMLDFSDGPAELFFVDDVRTSALCKVGKWVIPARSLSFIPWAARSALQRTRLGKINAGSGGPEERHNTIGIRYYQDRWRVGGPKHA